MKRIPSILLSYFKTLRPAKLVTLGYASYVLLGWAVLCLPIAATGAVSSLDHLFTAVSAVSTTGLVTVDPGSNYTAFGQAVILALIQLGGVGYMTVGSFVVLARKAPLSELRKEISRSAFSLPDGLHVEDLIRHVIVFTVVIEASGALALYFCFANAGVENPLWPAVFHSVSAFCTAGFSLFSTSLEAFRGDFYLNAVIAALSYLGAIGFIVMADVWAVVCRWKREITLTSKIILHVTLWLSVAGTLLIFLSEPSLRPLEPAERLLAAFFQAMTAMTTVGFDTHSMSAMARGPLFVILLLMICGASPSGTGGGIKSTTLSAMIGVVKSTMSGDREVRFSGRPIPEHRVRAATANFVLYLVLLAAGVLLLTLLEDMPFLDLAFESASAIGTVGLSMGVTPSLSPLGKIVVCLLMFLGRVGPLMASTAIFVPGEVPAAEGAADLAV